MTCKQSLGRNNIFTRLISLFVLIIVGTACDMVNSTRRSTIAAHKIVKDFSDEVNKEYSLLKVSLFESGSRESYRFLGVDFVIKKKLQKDQGRAILIDIVEKFLDRINNDLEFVKFIDSGKFSPVNTPITLIIQDPDGNDVVHPDIEMILSTGDNIIFYTTSPENPNRTKLKEYESYREAYEKAQRYLKTHDLQAELRQK